MFGKKKDKTGDILRWAKKNMESTEFQKLVSSKDRNPQAFMNAIENLHRLKDQMEGKSSKEDQQSKGKENPRRKEPKNTSTVSIKSRAKEKSKEIYSDIAIARKEHREYTKKIVPLETALESEEQKLQGMSNDIQIATQKVVAIGNREEQMLERAKYVCKTYPKALNKAKKLLDACMNEDEKREIQSDYDAMMKELGEMRSLKSSLDGFLAKAKEGTKVIFSTLFFGSKNRTVLQEIKLNAGGY